MIAKELLDARWKIIVGALIALAASIFTAYSFELQQQMLSGLDLEQLPAVIREELVLSLTNYDSYAWSQWFRNTGQQLFAVLAAFIGGTLIAGEVNKGTIYFLLSKPVTRERVLLTKYAVGAGALLALCLDASLFLLVASAVLGYPQSIAGVLMSTLLIWLGVLFIYGLAVLFSIIFDDILRPIGLAVVIAAILGLPSFFENGRDWTITNYWSSLPAYLGQEFPAREFAITLVVAAIPIALALLLFRRRAY